MRFLTFSAAAAVIMAASVFNVMGYTVNKADTVADGMVFTMTDNSKMKVQVCTDKIIRVVYTLRTSIPRADSNYIVVKGTWTPVLWTNSASATTYSITTASLRVDVAKATGAVSFLTASGTAIMNEVAGSKQLIPKTIAGAAADSGAFEFNGTNDEGLYGFGNVNSPTAGAGVQSGIFNQRGQTLLLAQHNQTDCSPFFMSTRGFGVLWINYSVMFLNPALKLSCKWATNDAIDYYFIYGPEFDPIIADYRTITGPATLWPKWAYGFWQCKNWYKSQNEILNIVKEYRTKKYPIDNIVQDWQYYPDGFNGCDCFNPSKYPDPAGMIKTLHDSLNCHFTISVWPSFSDPRSSGSGDNPHFDFMDSRGYLLSVSDYLGRTYDAFSDSAAYYYWKFINEGLVSINVDGFWPDATEPESYGWSDCMTSQGPATKVENIFPLLHSKTLYEGYRKANNEKKRVCNLTRSYYAGSQRLGAAYWTGDVLSDFPTFGNQVPAGLNVCMTGLPLFCTDIGGFQGVATAELEIRWFEWGAFNPVFRVHGTRPCCNELWSWNDASGQNADPNPLAESILVNYSRLRYRLFPYVYSLAWKVTNEGYTMMRGLPFDFRNDVPARDIGNEFLFGPSLLINPITTQGATLRSVYFPSGLGTWYDFWTGDTVIAGNGRTITAQAPLQIMPLYVRNGSILPMGPEITYADTAADPIELRVYTGADGSFTLYEDEGDAYNYEKGVYATIPITWNEASQDLSIGPTSGQFPGMLTSRTFNVVWVSKNHGAGETVTATIDKAIPYNGGKLTLNKTSGAIGVVYSPALTRGVSFSARLIGRKYIVGARGAAPVKIIITDVRGRAVAKAVIPAGSTSVVAQRLAPGTYCAQFNYGASAKSLKTFVVQ